MKTRPIPTIYLDEKIGKLNAQYARLELQGQHGVDQTETLIEIDDLSRVIRMEAQKWIASTLGEAIDSVVIEELGGTR